MKLAASLVTFWSLLICHGSSSNAEMAAEEAYGELSSKFFETFMGPDIRPSVYLERYKHQTTAARLENCALSQTVTNG